MEKEIWKRIDGYSDYYVSDLGRVKSTKFGKEKIIKSKTNNKGYLQVILCCNGKVKNYLIHRLVAKAFIENPAGLPCVNHIDEMKIHNFVQNLEWCSYTYNNNFGTKQERRKETLIKKGLCRSVKQLTLDGEVIGTYQSIRQAARISGIEPSVIWKNLNGIIKNPKEFRWEYIL